MEVDKDNIHFLIDFEPSCSIGYIVKCLKSFTTQRLWNNCTVCGRFIPFEDFNDKKAFSKLVSIDSAFSVEQIEYFCKKCAIKEKKQK